MKIKLCSIQHPRMDTVNSDTVNGYLPSEEKVSVTRYLRGWKVHLKITVDDIVFHDSDVSVDEIREVNILREKAQNTHFNQLDAKRARVNVNARMYLTEYSA